MASRKKLDAAKPWHRCVARFSATVGQFNLIISELLGQARTNVRTNGKSSSENPW